MASPFFVYLYNKMKELIFVIFGLSFFSVKAQTLEIYPTNTVAEINAKLKGLSGKGIVHFNEGVYLFKDVQKIQIKNNNLKLIGEGRGKTIFKFSDSTIVYNGFIQIDTASNIVIENISFDANNLNSSRSGIILTQKSNDVSILNNEFKNLHNNNGMMYAINIPAINVKNFVIKNNSFSNISSLGDSIIGTNEGMSGAILIHVGKIKPTDFPSNGRISYNHIENIFLDQSNGYKDYDSDGIRFFIPNNSEKFDKIYKKTVIIEYNQIINVQKSGVKSQSFPGLVIKDNYIFSDREDFSMFAGIRIYGKDHMSQHILIKNNKINFSEIFKLSFHQSQASLGLLITISSLTKRN